MKKVTFIIVRKDDTIIKKEFFSYKFSINNLKNLKNVKGLYLSIINLKGV